MIKIIKVLAGVATDRGVLIDQHRCQETSSRVSQVCNDVLDEYHESNTCIGQKYQFLEGFLYIIMSLTGVLRYRQRYHGCEETLRV